jgi:hypothetical protein
VRASFQILQIDFLLPQTRNSLSIPTKVNEKTFTVQISLTKVLLYPHISHVQSPTHFRLPPHTSTLKIKIASTSQYETKSID